VYRDLSAKLFKVDIKSEKLKSDGVLNFKIGPESLNLDYIKLLIFGISNNKLTLLSEGIDVIVGNLDSYQGLLACVVNSGNESPYTGTSKIELSIRSIDSLPPEGIMTISAKFLEDLYLKTATDEYDIIGADYIDHYVTGKVKLINDSTYWGEWDEDDQIGYHHKGSMTVVIDPLTKNLKYFESDEVRDVDRGIVATEKIISKLLDLPPFRTNIYSWDFIEYDKQAKDALQTLEYKEVASDPGSVWEQTLIRFYTNDKSYVRVHFNFEE
ncbi:MAG: hypothetical protein R3250_07550, partial [Melioribacteraceae bacterium]|nr:hypothetical protein [Melioribacteraceae bacterium]